MNTPKHLKHFTLGALTVALSTLLTTGCKTTGDACCPTTIETSAAPAVAAPAPATAAVAPEAAKPAPPVVKPSTVRIKTATVSPFTDTDGNVWLADQGFADGETIDRYGITISNTSNPGIYLSERYSMTAFSYPLPNGNYVVKLHFAETFEGIEGPGDRVFSFNVEGTEFKDYDIWVKAGGPLRAHVESVPVEITDGKLDITFTPKIENPCINGIEIIPAS
ncbi:MAG TPA: malectin [Verrucomicrobiota bacterium]|nr:malectin [Verrucomicrobiota bacterium]